MWKRRKSKAPQYTLVLDTETSHDTVQQLDFGCWRLYVDAGDELPGSFCVQEGLFYADNLPERNPAGYALLQTYVADTVRHPAGVVQGNDAGLQLLSRTQFVERVFFFYGYTNQATIVGFNLPFDLARIAIGATEARKGMRGGNSLRIFDDDQHRPRVTYRTIDSRRALISFTSTRFRRYEGRFLDLRTLAYVLTDKGFSLEGACHAFGIPYHKATVTYGEISEPMVDYCRADVEATSALHRATMEELSRHPVDLQPWSAFSPATLGKAYLYAMGIKPILARQERFDRAVLAAGMAAYFGGRAESRIRKTPLPVVYLDFLSMYPSTSALMKLWRLITAREIHVEHPVEEVRSLLASPDLRERCFDPSTWEMLCCLVEVEPGGAILPVRAQYDAATDSYNIGINPFHYRGSSWYSLADVIASVLLGGDVPTIVSAISLHPSDDQLEGLTWVTLRGEELIDPRTGDFFTRVIERRKGIQRAAGGSAEEERLPDFLKVLANSASYGIMAEFQREELTEATLVEVASPDGESYDFSTENPEEPGLFCFPPLAAFTTGGARLMLALLEGEVEAAGGHFVFCDTDSFAVVSSPQGGSISCHTSTEDEVRVLTHTQVEEVVRKFSSLNPYDPSLVGDSILEVEEENFTEERERQELWCWSISAKRYVLFTREEESFHIVKASEHGLGHLLNPLDPEDESSSWIEEVWTYLLAGALELPREAPHWLDRPALTRITASGPSILSWFAALNEGKPYCDCVKPGNFVLLAHVDPLDGTEALPIAPYESDASKWFQLPWVDRITGLPITITTEHSSGMVRPGVVRVKSYRDVLQDYLTHPEAKSLSPEGAHVTGSTTGLLLRRPVSPLGSIKLVGKESNKLEEREVGYLTEEHQFQLVYSNVGADQWRDLVVPVLKRMDPVEVSRQVGLHLQTVERRARGTGMPRPKKRAAITGLAVGFARDELRSSGLDPRGSDSVVLGRYLELVNDDGPRCRGCGKPLTGRQVYWCSEACRKGSRRPSL